MQKIQNLNKNIGTNLRPALIVNVETEFHDSRTEETIFISDLRTIS